jgi:beta-galactosidase
MMGDRSGGGNNPMTVFSNCDEVEVIIGEINVGKFKPDAENYPHLQHPPFVIYGLNEFSAWGQRRFYDLRLVGYLDGKPVIEQNISSNKLPKKMLLKTSTAELLADGSDMAQISFFLTDEYNNPLPYARNIIHFELDGEGQIIGENPFPMMGGQGAVYVKAGKVPGVITITARTPELGEQKITLKVINAA